MTNRDLNNIQELREIQAQLHDQFPEEHLLSQTLRDKLAHCIHRSDRCRDLLRKALQAQQGKEWKSASPAQRSEFLQNIERTREKIAELRRLIRGYLAALHEAKRCLAARA
jgi:hypothetical protein